MYRFQVSLVLCATLVSTASFALEQKERFQFLQQFEGNGEFSKEKLEAYQTQFAKLAQDLSEEELKSAFMTSPAVVTAARKDLLSRYSKSINTTAKKSEECGSLKNTIAKKGRWLADAKKKFGEAYIHAHAEDMALTIAAIYFEHDAECRRPTEALAIYDEDRYLSYESEVTDQLSKLLDSKDQAFKTKHADALSMIAKYQELVKKRPVKVITSTGIKSLMTIIWEGKISPPKEIVNFLYKHPDLKPPFNVSYVQDLLKPYFKK